MTRGTTRQLLHDLEAARNRVSPVRVLRGEDDSRNVQVTISPDAQALRGARNVLYYLPAAIGGIALVSLLLAFTVGPPFQIGFIVFGWAAVLLFAVALAGYDRSGRSYVFRLGREMVSVDSAGMFGPRHCEWERNGVREVQLLRGKRSGVAFDLASRWRNPAAFMLDLPREEILALVNALREGLGLPPQALR